MKKITAYANCSPPTKKNTFTHMYAMDQSQREPKLKPKSARVKNRNNHNTPHQAHHRHDYEHHLHATQTHKYTRTSPVKLIANNTESTWDPSTSAKWSIFLAFPSQLIRFFSLADGIQSLHCGVQNRMCCVVLDYVLCVIRVCCCCCCFFFWAHT